MLNDIIETAKLHHSRANDNFSDIKVFAVDLGIFSDKEKIKTIDAFIYRFIKLQDYMGSKLFRQLLVSIGEYADNMSLLDILDKMEKLDIITNSDKWLEYRITRNRLTHEYPDNQEEVIEDIKLSLQYFEEIGEILESVISYCVKKKLTTN
ncbi:MAG: hypothetical protein ACYTFY_17775 [Planctomycetota bacterium]|jgi:hypothetical protein